MSSYRSFITLPVSFSPDEMKAIRALYSKTYVVTNWAPRDYVALATATADWPFDHATETLLIGRTVKKLPGPYKEVALFVRDRDAPSSNWTLVSVEAEADNVVLENPGKYRVQSGVLLADDVARDRWAHDMSYCIVAAVVASGLAALSQGHWLHTPPTGILFWATNVFAAVIVGYSCWLLQNWVHDRRKSKEPEKPNRTIHIVK